MTEDGVLQRMQQEASLHLGAAAAMSLLQQKYALAIVRALLSGPSKFGELQSATRARSATTLQARLEDLQRAGVTERSGGVMRLTPTGRGLAPLYSALDRYSARFPDSTPEQILTVLQRRDAMRIMRELISGKLGFNDLRRAVGAASDTTLARRLSDLEALGLIEKTVHSAMPPRTTYAHSARGAAFSEVIGHIVFWGEGLPLALPGEH